MKTIDELDLLDDYLNNAVASNKEIGELCYRRVLSVLLQKEIGKLRIVCQRTLPAFLPGLRGIRMDVEIKELQGEKVTNVYDLEQHKQKNLNLPKHNRFYQAKIDSRGLKRGEKDFSKIPNLYVITITNFDPFGYDYMMYTVKNSCVEIPDLSYEDGLQFVYFNTKGRKGGSKAIQSMLTYMQDSNEEHAVDEATREVHSYVSRIKSMEEVREGYMTFGDLIDMEREEAANKAAKEATDKATRKTGTEFILELLEEYGEVSESVRSKIEAETDIETLKRWHKLAARVDSIEEFQKLI